MEAQYLVYKGTRDEGTLIVKRAYAASPERFLKYHLGMRLHVGTDVSEQVAKWVSNDHKDLFQIETVPIDASSWLSMAFNDLVVEVRKDLSHQQIIDIVGNVLSKDKSNAITTANADLAKEEQTPDESGVSTSSESESSEKTAAKKAAPKKARKSKSKKSTKSSGRVRRK